MTAVGRDFLLKPINPGAAGVAELRDGGEKTLHRKRNMKGWTESGEGWRLKRRERCRRKEEERRENIRKERHFLPRSATWHAVASGAPMMLSAPLNSRFSWGNSKGRGLAFRECCDWMRLSLNWRAHCIVSTTVRPRVSFQQSKWGHLTVCVCLCACVHLLATRLCSLHEADHTVPTSEKQQRQQPTISQ